EFFGASLPSECRTGPPDHLRDPCGYQCQSRPQVLLSVAKQPQEQKNKATTPEEAQLEYLFRPAFPFLNGCLQNLRLRTRRLVDDRRIVAFGFRRFLSSLIFCFLFSPIRFLLSLSVLFNQLVERAGLFDSFFHGRFVLVED